MKDHANLNDYTIYTSGIPKTGVEITEVWEHFERYGEIWDTTFSYRFGNALKAYMKQDKLNKKIRKREVQVKIKAEKEDDPDKSIKILDDKKLIKLKAADNKMEDKLWKKFPNLKTMADLHKLGAFVTFNKVQDMVNCFWAYNGNWYKKSTEYATNLLQITKDDKKLKGKHTLKAEVADAPSNIMWENLEVGKCESCCRSFLVLVVMVVVLFFSFTVIYLIRVYTTKMVTKQGCTAF